MAKYQITGPDGATYEVTAPDDASEADVMKYVQDNYAGTQRTPSKLEAFRAEQAARDQPPALRNRPLLGGGEAALALGTGAIAGPVSGFMGLAGAMLPGPAGQGAEWQRRVAEGMTYQPRSIQGQAGLDVISAPFVKLSELSNQWGEAVQEGYMGTPLQPLAPALGTLANVTGNFLPALVAKGAARPAMAPAGVPRGTALPARSEPTMAGHPPAMLRSGRQGPTLPAEDIRPAAPAPQAISTGDTVPLSSIRHPVNRVKYETWKEANAAGYKFPPTQIEDTFLRGRIEGVGGKAATKQQATIENQQVTNELARKAAGLEPRTPIDEGVLASAREAAAAPYREVAAISPRAATALEKLKEVRAEAKIYHRHADISGDPTSVKKARQLDDTAATYEKLIDREATQAGRPDLLGRLREARRRIAMNWDVDRALNVGSGEVDAAVFGRMLDKRGVQGMSGELLLIAKTAKAFPQFMGLGSKTPTPGVGALEMGMSLGLGFGGGIAAGPYGSLAAALPFVRPVARKFALSKRMQTPLRARAAGLSLRDVARGAALPLAITTSLGLRPPEEE